MKLIYRTDSGQTVWRDQTTLLIKFPTRRSIATTSALNGGVRENIEAVFNHTVPQVSKSEDLPGGSVPEYLRLVALGLGLKPENCSGLLTAAQMENAAWETLTFRQLEVQAVVTAGIDINGGRAADPAAYYEEAGCFQPLGGTINILLAVNANLPPETRLKSIITATEAKCAALQELLAPSQYSSGLATGSGTDGIIVVADPASSLVLTDAGQHSKLGELIGCTVKTAVKKALARETGLTPARQMNILAQMKRFKLGPEYCWQRAVQFYPQLQNYEEYCELLTALSSRPELVAQAAAVIHLQDQVQWGLLPPAQATAAARAMLASYHYGKGQAEPGPSPTSSLLDLLIDKLNALIYRELETQNSNKRGSG
ncbi:MAG: adenosylcobinamide amidohydrolase [Clostridia bacterium]|nr:adenosylcobinamide amidohydrolase [Clostridia bacterium]